MILKQNVSLSNLQPQMVVALLTCAYYYRQRGIPVVVTSANDGDHSHTSLHYAGCAVDIRTKHLATNDDKVKITAEIKNALGRDFDVLLEHLGRPNEHIHIEYQPRRR